MSHRATPSPQQLSLFDTWPEPAAQTLPARAPASPPVPTPVPPAAPPLLAATPLQDAAPRFQHPRADRSIRLGEHLVGYVLRRARRRSIGFSIGPEGLAVAAPRWVSAHDIEQALRAKADWILRKLHEQHERGRRLAATRIAWRDGATLPFLGQPLTIVLDPRASGVVLQPEPDPGAVAGPAGVAPPAVRTLSLGLPPHAGAAQIRDAVQGWLQRQARRIFDERCAHFAARLGVTVRRVSLSSAATRWGSASADGSVRLHWRLVHFAPAVIDYVVTHELAHLREMNHSPAFWDIVRSVLPDFEQPRVALRAQVLPSFE